MVRAGLCQRIILGQRGRSVSQGRWINVIEARAAVPQRLPLRMRPMLLEESRVGDEGALDRRPFVEVFGLEQRPDQARGQKKNGEKIGTKISPAAAGVSAHRLTGAADSAAA